MITRRRENIHVFADGSLWWPDGGAGDSGFIIPTMS
jgi:hypothetical protein